MKRKKKNKDNKIYHSERSFLLNNVSVDNVELWVSYSSLYFGDFKTVEELFANNYYPYLKDLMPEFKKKDIFKVEYSFVILGCPELIEKEKAVENRLVTKYKTTVENPSPYFNIISEHLPFGEVYHTLGVYDIKLSGKLYIKYYMRKIKKTKDDNKEDSCTKKEPKLYFIPRTLISYTFDLKEVKSLIHG